PKPAAFVGETGGGGARTTGRSGDGGCGADGRDGFVWGTGVLATGCGGVAEAGATTGTAAGMATGTAAGEAIGPSPGTTVSGAGGVSVRKRAPTSKISPFAPWILVVGDRGAACSTSFVSSSSAMSLPAFPDSPRR